MTPWRVRAPGMQIVGVTGVYWESKKTSSARARRKAEAGRAVYLALWPPAQSATDGSCRLSFPDACFPTLSRTLQVPPAAPDLGHRPVSGARGGRLEAGFTRYGDKGGRGRVGRAGGTETNFGKGRSPFSPVCLCVLGEDCPTPGRWVNDTGPHLCSPRGGGGAGWRHRGQRGL